MTLWITHKLLVSKRYNQSMSVETLTLDQIVHELERGNIMPTRAADLMPVVAAKYSRAADNYIVCNANFAQKFTETRDNYKSDTATNNALERKEVGLERANWKYQMRKAEMCMKALNGFIYQKTAEAKNEQ